MKHFLQETDFTRDEIVQFFSMARHFKQERGRHEKPLAGQTWAMIFANHAIGRRAGGMPPTRLEACRAGCLPGGGRDRPPVPPGQVTAVRHPGRTPGSSRATLALGTEPVIPAKAGIQRHLDTAVSLA